MTLRTWQMEAGGMLALLCGTAGLEWYAGADPIGTLLSGAAVFSTFLHGQVSDRLRAYATRTSADTPDCARLETRYYIAKELLWFAFFAWMVKPTAIIGTAAFLLYPVWRAAHARRKGLGREPLADDALMRDGFLKDARGNYLLRSADTGEDIADITPMNGEFLLYVQGHETVLVADLWSADQQYPEMLRASGFEWHPGNGWERNHSWAPEETDEPDDPSPA